MRLAEHVTFGGSGLDRAAHVRDDETALQAAVSHPLAKAVVLWRGKPLLAAGSLDQLILVPMDHPVLRAGLGRAVMMPVFLGRDEAGAPLFGCDVSGWEPDDLDPAALGQFLDSTEQVHPDLPTGSVFAELRRVMGRLSPRDAELAAMVKAIIGWHETHKFCAKCGAASKIAQAGWQRSCPDCGGQHFPRTDPVVIMLITHGNSVLMGRSHFWPAGMYSLLAGFVEPGETLEAAVRREVFEEAGIRVGQVGYLASQPWPFPASLMIGCSGVALGREITIDPKEIEDAIWVSRDDMMMAYSGEHRLLKPARKGSIAHFLIENWLADTLD